MKLSNVVEGKHNHISFRFEDGLLTIAGKDYDKWDIQMMVEIANLLEHQGYKLKVPKQVKSVKVHNMFGEGYDTVKKTYTEEENETSN